MTRWAKRQRQAAAARARARKAANIAQEPALPDLVEVSDSSDDEVCKYNHGITYISSSENDSSLPSSLAGSDESAWEDLSELDGEAFDASVRAAVAHAQEEETQVLASDLPSAYSIIQQAKTATDWKQAEAKRGFGYTGRSQRTVRRHAQEARKKEEHDEVARNRQADFAWLSVLY